MKTRAILALSAVAGLAAGASAQSFTTDSTVTINLTWSEVNGNGNNMLDPGESAHIRMSVSFSNQNAVANFAPSIGTFGSGTIRGLGSGFLDLNGSGGAEGSWNLDPNEGYGVDEIWDITNGQGHGTLANGGATLLNLQFGQFAPGPAQVNTTNPIVDIWEGLWTPNDYSSRTVTFSTAGAAAAGNAVSSVTLRLSATIAASAFVQGNNLVHGSVSIPIVPAPSSLALLGLGGLVVARRRR